MYDKSAYILAAIAGPLSCFVAVCARDIFVLDPFGLFLNVIILKLMLHNIIRGGVGVRGWASDQWYSDNYFKMWVIVLLKWRIFKETQTKSSLIIFLLTKTTLFSYWIVRNKTLIKIKQFNFKMMLLCLLSDCCSRLSSLSLIVRLHICTIFSSLVKTMCTNTSLNLLNLCHNNLPC